MARGGSEFLIKVISFTTDGTTTPIHVSPLDAVRKLPCGDGGGRWTPRYWALAWNNDVWAKGSCVVHRTVASLNIVDWCRAEARALWSRRGSLCA